MPALIALVCLLVGGCGEPRSESATPATIRATASATTTPATTFRYLYPDKTVLAEGAHLGGQRDGRFRVWWRDGKPWVDGHYAGGVRHGEWVHTDREGTVTRETWDRGRVLGRRQIVMADGTTFLDEQVREPPLVPEPAVVLTGPETVEKIDGVVRTRERLWNGRSYGLALQWHSNGVLAADMKMWNGLKVDFMFVWDETGSLERVVEFDADGNTVDLIEIRPQDL